MNVNLKIEVRTIEEAQNALLAITKLGCKNKEMIIPAMFAYPKGGKFYYYTNGHFFFGSDRAGFKKMKYEEIGIDKLQELANPPTTDTKSETVIK